jgi:hypothetical protein
MSKKRSGIDFLELLDSRALAKSSRLRAGKVQARGVPAILLGVASIVVATGLASALRRSAAMLPETLREARFLLVAMRGARGELPH